MPRWRLLSWRNSKTWNCETVSERASPRATRPRTTGDSRLADSLRYTPPDTTAPAFRDTLRLLGAVVYSLRPIPAAATGTPPRRHANPEATITWRGGPGRPYWCS